MTAIGESGWEAGVRAASAPPWLEVSPSASRAAHDVVVRLRAARNAPIERVWVRAIINGIDHHYEAAVESVGERSCWYAARFALEQPRTHYHFLIRTVDGATYYATRLGVSSVYPSEAYDWSVDTSTNAPAWIGSSTFYQIFPDRFHRGRADLGVRDGEIVRDDFASRAMEWADDPLPYPEGGSLDFFNGDLPGIEAKLDYLADLGVSALYLTPVFTAKTNHRYDCLDYFAVDPHLGGDEALASLIRAAHERGMRIILDVSINHVGVEHPWAGGVQIGGRRVDFVLRDDQGRVVNWLGVDDLLKLDYRTPELRETVYRRRDSVVQRYLREPFGIDGWRFDVASEVGNHGQTQQGHEVWREIRDVVKSINPDAYILGEHWHDATAWVDTTQWDSAMNYFGSQRPIRMWLGEQDRFAVSPSAEAVPGRAITGRELNALLHQHFARIPSGFLHAQFNLLDSHDVTRMHTEGPLFSWPRYEGAVMLLFLLPGTVSVYYGDEVGLGGTLDGDHGKRFPMEWNESRWDARFVALYRRMIALKRTEQALHSGGWSVIDSGNDFLVFARWTVDRSVVLLLNRAAEEREWEIDLRSLGVTSVRAFEPIRDGRSDPLDAGEYDADHVEGVVRVRTMPETSALLRCDLST
ncbi:MAG: alpha-amylase family glycosyl hydrolase [Spirochaetota bacterium]